MSLERLGDEQGKRGESRAPQQGESQGTPRGRRWTAPVNGYCERCGGAQGSLIVGNVAECRCGRRVRRSQAELAKIDPEASMTFAHLTDSHESLAKAARAAEQMAIGERSRGLMLFGQPGRGKTHVAVAAIRRALALEPRGKLAGYFNCASLIGRIQSTYGYDDADESRASIVEDVCSHELVVLDDLGKEHASANVESIVYEIVDGLYRARIPTIISSNLPGDAFVGRYDDAIRSRIEGMCELAAVYGDDRRLSRWQW